jgi:UDP-glucose 4-epimerase
MIVLITGAFGFLGRYTAKEFKMAGYEVIAIGHGDWSSDEYTKWGIDFWFETTITFDALLKINRKFDLIVHCGGSGSVGFSQENPFEDFQKSVLSTLALLEYIRLHNPTCKFIYPSSPAVQGNLENIPIKEDLSSTPASPYGFHKKIAEELCLSYYKNFKIEIGVIRFFSIYGPGLKKQLIWDTCIKIQQSNEVVFFGTGGETRDWLHVRDAASLVYKLSKDFTGYQVVNGGSGTSTRVDQMIRLISKHFKKPVKISFNGQVKEGDPIYFWADNRKALAIGWTPKIDIDEGIKEYVAYFNRLSE